MQPTSTDAQHGDQPPGIAAANHARLSQFIEAEAESLLKTISFYVYKARLGSGKGVREEAQEVLGDVVVEALRNVQRFDPERSPRAWLLAIAANIIRRHQERARKLAVEVPVRAIAPTQAEDMHDEEIWDFLTGIAPGDLADEVAAAEGAASLLALVSEADQHVLRLAILHDLNGSMLAQALGVTPGTARVQLHRAILRLRDGWRATTGGAE